MDSFVAVVEGGVIRVAEGHAIPNGRRVLVIALPAGIDAGTDAPPQDLLDEDERELRPTAERLRALNAKALP